MPDKKTNPSFHTVTNKPVVTVISPDKPENKDKFYNKKAFDMLSDAKKKFIKNKEKKK